MGKSKKKVQTGVVFPLTGGGKRSTTITGKGILTNAFEAVEVGAGSSLKNEKDRKWRHGYQKHVAKAVEMMASDASDANKMADAGLSAVSNTMEFLRDGKTCPLVEAMDSKAAYGTFSTKVVKGQGQRKDGLVLRAGNGGTIDSVGLLNTIKPLVDQGNMEASCQESVRNVLDHLEWLDLSDFTFIMLGATSEMGPLQFLLDCGASVVAVARPAATIVPGDKRSEKARAKGLAKWQGILKRAQSSPGTLYVPCSSPVTSDNLDDIASVCGADCMTQTPELANWLSTVLPGAKQVHMGLYIYQDGESFVRAVAAMDAIASQVATRRRAAYPNANPVGLLFIETPSNFHAVPEHCQTISRNYLNNAPIWQKVLQFCGVLKPLKFVTDSKLLTIGDKPGVLMDGLISVQGPNYALAKLIQRWRIIKSRSAGQLVSVNVGPATATSSVMHVDKVATALKMCHLFPPQQLFQPDIVKAVLSLLLVRDLRDPKALAQPSTKIGNVLELVADQAWHGGLWTTSFASDSTGAIQFILGTLKKHLLVLLLGIALLGYLFLFR